MSDDDLDQRSRLAIHRHNVTARAVERATRHATAALRALVDYIVLRDACVGCGENLGLSRCRFHCDECTPGEPETISDEPLRAAQELLKRLGQ